MALKPYYPKKEKKQKVTFTDGDENFRGDLNLDSGRFDRENEEQER